jgi:hypothetical protein
MKEKLEQEIKDAKKKLEELEKKAKTDNRSLAIKSLEEYTNEEKIKFFDKLYENALEELEELEKEGYSNEDNAIERILIFWQKIMIFFGNTGIHLKTNN